MLDAYERISEELNQAPWFGRTPDLTRMDALLDELGLPQANTKNIIVTGTDGKGSVCSYLHSILGRRYKVGRFISPHLEEWTERITVGKDDISREDFARLYVKVMEGAKKACRVSGEMPTVFERLLAMALLYFEEQGTEWNVIEVGIEGRYDSTNLLPAKAVVVTSVGMDHMRLLGNTIEEIADAISAAFRPHAVAVIGKTDPAAMNILEVNARRKKLLFTGTVETFGTMGSFSVTQVAWTFNLLLGAFTSGTTLQLPYKQCWRCQVPSLTTSTLQISKKGFEKPLPGQDGDCKGESSNYLGWCTQSSCCTVAENFFRLAVSR